MFLKKSFASRLVELRKENAVSQGLVAEAAGVGRTSITMLETGERAPSVEVLVALADYFDVSIDYLVGRDDVPKRW